MELLTDATLFVHLIGMAALVGGAFVQLRDEVRVVNASMLYGAMAQVLSGLLLVGLQEGDDVPVDHVKVAVKLAIGLVVGVLCWINRTREDVPRGLFDGIAGLTVVNVAVAVFW